MMDEPMSQAGTNMPWQIVTIPGQETCWHCAACARKGMRSAVVVGHTLGKPNCHPSLHESSIAITI